MYYPLANLQRSEDTGVLLRSNQQHYNENVITKNLSEGRFLLSQGSRQRETTDYFFFLPFVFFAGAFLATGFATGLASCFGV